MNETSSLSHVVAKACDHDRCDRDRRGGCADRESGRRRRSRRAVPGRRRRRCSARRRGRRPGRDAVREPGAGRPPAARVASAGIAGAEEALQPVSPNEGSGPVVPSPAERPPPTSVTASPAPPPSPADPSAGGAPPPESPQAELPDWYQNQGIRDMPQILADGTHVEQQGTGNPFTAAEPMTSEQPQASSPPGAIQLGPVNIQISIRIASPGDNGSVTQVNAVVTAAPGSSAPCLDDHDRRHCRKPGGIARYRS